MIRPTVGISVDCVEIVNVFVLEGVSDIESRIGPDHGAVGDGVHNVIFGIVDDIFGPRLGEPGQGLARNDGRGIPDILQGGRTGLRPRRRAGDIFHPDREGVHHADVIDAGVGRDRESNFVFGFLAR